MKFLKVIGLEKDEAIFIRVDMIVDVIDKVYGCDISTQEGATYETKEVLEHVLKRLGVEIV